jgi:hypothetical protein
MPIPDAGRGEGDAREPGAVHQQMHRLAISPAAESPPRHIQRSGSPVEGGPRRLMIEPIKPSVWRRARTRASMQRCQDRQCRIPRLAAAGCPRRRSPNYDRLLSESDRQATLPHARVVGRPIRHLALLLWDMVAAAGVGLERHRRFRISRGRTPIPTRHRPQRPIHATAPRLSMFRHG